MLNITQQNVKNDLGIIDGELRILLPSDLGRHLILPWLNEFIEIH
tara:strand:+ start:2881 stop:3015 length:135 start_codon:yes stop_codon:yes gene_type:complete